APSSVESRRSRELSLACSKSTFRKSQWMNAARSTVARRKSASVSKQFSNRTLVQREPSQRRNSALQSLKRTSEQFAPIREIPVKRQPRNSIRRKCALFHSALLTLHFSRRESRSRNRLSTEPSNAERRISQVSKTTPLARVFDRAASPTIE